MEKPKISFDTERLYIRSVEETDKDDYMNLRVETSELSQAYQSVPGFRDYEWEGELNSQKDIYMAVFSGKPVMIRTNVTNTACRRVAEKCGGVFSGYEPTLAAKAIASLMESYGNKPTDDEELLEMRQRNAEFIEENKEGVCVYRFE